jgi:hypothetical protein
MNTQNQSIPHRHIAVKINGSNLDMWLTDYTDDINLKDRQGKEFRLIQSPFCVSDILVGENENVIGLDVTLLGDRKVSKILRNNDRVTSDFDFHFSIWFQVSTSRTIAGIQSIHNALFEDQVGNWLMILEVGDFSEQIQSLLIDAKRMKGSI